MDLTQRHRRAVAGVRRPDLTSAALRTLTLGLWAVVLSTLSILGWLHALRQPMPMTGMDMHNASMIGLSDTGRYLDMGATMTATMMLPALLASIYAATRHTTQHPPAEPSPTPNPGTHPIATERSGSAPLPGPLRFSVSIAVYSALWTVTVATTCALLGSASIAQSRYDLSLIAGRHVAVVTLVAAGLFQLSRRKRDLLARCILIAHNPTIAGSTRRGLSHGAACVGCCGPVMLAATVTGATTPTSMALATALIVLERLHWQPFLVRSLSAMTLSGLAAWIALATGLHDYTQIAAASIGLCW